MKLSTFKLRKIIVGELNLLTEQDDMGTAVEDEAASPDEELDAEEETTGTDEPAAEDEAAEEKEAELEPPEEEITDLSKAVDDELNALFVDFESNALGATSSTSDDSVESISENYNLMRLLYEQEEIPKIDMEIFASDVARLVKNYDSLLDMEGIILTKAVDYIANKYDENYAGELMNILDLRYDLSLEDEEEDEEVDPLAVGASAVAAATA